MKRIRVTFEVDLDTGDYDVTYNNASAPGEPIDLTRTLAVMRKVFFEHQHDAETDAILSGQGVRR